MNFQPNLFAHSFVRTVCFVVAAAGLYVAVQTQSPAADDAKTTGRRSELFYVPIYSSIYYENGKQTLELAATLSMHNVNPDRQLTISRVDYYDTSGKLLKKYLDKPLVLGALQTKNIVIEKANKEGGPGANFLVEWEGEPEATSPLIEAVHVNASSNLGIAFTTSAKLVRHSGK